MIAVIITSFGLGFATGAVVVLTMYISDKEKN